jgi:hypothetical protein
MVAVEQDLLWQKIDASKYLYLGKLFEPRCNSLTIILEEATTADTGDGTDSEISTSYVAIQATPACSVFTLHWDSYISYCVTEEMHGSCGDYEGEEYSGRLLRIYSKSHFLDFIGRDTGAHFHPYRHYKIACLNHVIDIASSEAPQITAKPYRSVAASTPLPIGVFKTFGKLGPLYQVRGPAKRGPKGEMVAIEVIESRERLDYPLADVLADPLAE